MKRLIRSGGLSRNRNEVRALIQTRLTGNERLLDDIVLTPQGSGPVRGMPLVEFERRRGESTEDHIARFVGGRA